MTARRAGLVLLAWLVLVPLPALGHSGAHGDAGSHDVVASVTLQGYRIALLTHSGPLQRGRESRLTASLSDAQTGAPVTPATVLIGVASAGMSPAQEPADEDTWAGHYTITVRPQRTGAHHVLVTVRAVGGRALDPPLGAELPVHVQPPAGPGLWTWGLLAAITVVAGTTLAWQMARARRGLASSAPLDLLELRWFARAFTWRGWSWLLPTTVLVVVGLVVVLGLADVADGGLNLATRLTWTLWWAGIIFTFVLVGRVWCVACPFGALNEWAARLARPARRLPAPFRNIWWATGLFVLLTWADEQLGVVRSPRFTAWLVLALAAAAIAVGLLFERRSFCRYLCPIGGVIGLYAMTAPVALRAKHAAVCRADRDQGCYRPTAHAQGCPMFEFPATMDRNTYCTLCGECLRGCQRKNLALRLRAFGTDLWASSRRTLDEAYLAVVVAALTLLVTAGMLPAWGALAAAIGGWLPSLVRQHLKPVTYLALVESALLLVGSLVVGPLLLAAASAWSRRRAGARAASLRRTFVTFAYMLIPVGLGLHLAHNLGHLLLEGAGVLAALQRAVRVFTPWSLGEPDWSALAVAPPVVVLLVQVAIVTSLFALSMVAGRRLSSSLYDDAAVAARAQLPMTILVLTFTAAAILLLVQPMGARHLM